MTPTTIKLPEELKQRIGALIEGSGKSMHAFLLEAIELCTDQAERRQQFVAVALDAREETLRTGKGFAARQVHPYVRARSAGKKVARPRAKSWRK